jgi:selenocysteine lyase/cysteine desulfurase
VAAAAERAGAETLTVSRRDGQTWSDAIVADLDDRVRIVSVPNVHWTDGALVDLDAIAARAHEVDARLVIDASQSVGAMPLNVARLQPDYVVTVGYKWLLGPFAVGYLYAADQHREGTPIEQNWIVRSGAQDFARLVDYRDEYQPGAWRFDSGQRTKFELTPMAVAALEQISSWGVARIAAALAGTTETIAQGVEQLGLASLPADQRGPHMLGVHLPEDIRGHVLPALTEANCFAAVRRGSLRIAPHLHSTKARHRKAARRAKVGHRRRPEGRRVTDQSQGHWLDAGGIPEQVPTGLQGLAVTITTTHGIP